MGSVEAGPYDFSEEEISAVRNKFSKLELIQPGTWKGILDIDAVYNGHRIQDFFEVLIVATDKYPEEIPMIAEVGGRTKAIGDKYNLKDRRDLHYNLANGIACLCVKQEEKIKFPPGSNLVNFIDNLVTPYFYSLSYFDQNGKWPWGERSHGGLGLLEFYAENPVTQSKEEIENLVKVFRQDKNWKEYNKQIRKLSGGRSCLCGSGRPFKKCHSQAWQGIKRLVEDSKKLRINIDSMFKM